MKRNVVTSSWVAVFLCKPEVDNKGGEALITKAHQYILRFDVAMDITMQVDLLKASVMVASFISSSHLIAHVYLI